MTFVVGMPVSLSGQFQAQGRQALAGLQAWARDVNYKSPGSFRVVHYDDISTGSGVREATRRLIEDDQVDILIGPYSSVLTSLAAQLAEDYEQLLWNQGGASDNVYEQGYNWVVGILTPASQYLVGLLSMVRAFNSSADTVALVMASTGEFSKAVCSGVLKAAQSQGFRVVLATEFPPLIEDFEPVIDELRAARPDVLVIAGRVQNDLRLARQLAESGIEAGVVVAVAAGIQGFQDDLGSLSDRFVGPSQWEPQAGYEPQFGPAAEEIVASLQRDGYERVDYPAVQAYAAGLVVQKCLYEAGSANSRALRDAAKNLKFSTFYGGFEIDGETGRQIGRETLLIQWQGERKVIVGPLHRALEPLLYPWR